MAKLEFKYTMKVLKSLGNKLELEAKNNLQAKGHVATGRLLKSVKHKIMFTARGIELQLLSEAYGDVLDKGLSGSQVSRPGTPYRATGALTGRGTVRSGISPGGLVYINYRDIRKWAAIKGIGGNDIDRAASNIRRHLIREGYAASHWKSRAKEEIRSELRNKLGGAAKQDLKRMWKSLRFPSSSNIKISRK